MLPSVPVKMAVFVALSTPLGCGGNTTPRELVHEAAPEFAPSALRLNEVCSSNLTVQVDETGKTPDFIELYNSGDQDLSLNGYGLSDNDKAPHQWQFGDVTIGAGKYLLVMASGRNVTSVNQVVPAPKQAVTAFVWSWADSEAATPGGSYVIPDQFGAKFAGSIDGKPAISARFFLADNAATIGWNTAILHQGFVDWDGSTFADFSAYNQAYLEAFIEEGVRVNLALCNADSECSESYQVTLEGTGRERERYPIAITGEPEGLDLTKLHGFELHPVTLGREFSVVVTDLVFSHGGSFLHTNFKLDKNGETLWLSNAEGALIDRYETPRLKPDVSYGQSAVQAGERAVFSVPTPGADNSGPEWAGVCSPPAWTKPSGFYQAALEPQATSSASCQIHYTLDGTTPSRDAKELGASLAVTESVVVRSMAAGDQWLESEVTTQSYFVNDAHELAVVSIVTEPGLLFDEVTGIYEKGPNASAEFPYKGANFWQDTEIPATAQFFEPGGKLGFESGVGLSIFGNYSRGNDMKSLAVHFRNEYGDDHLDYALFPSRPELTSFDAFVLRNSGGDFGHTMFRDAFASSLTDTMGLDYQAYRPTIVYINGKYWGLHNLREKLNADYFETHFGWSRNEFDLLRPGEASAQVGNAKEWTALQERLTSLGAVSDENYAYVASQVDIDNFIDYVNAELYFGNSDWPGNNVKWYKHRGDGKWKWVLYDLDAGFSKPDFDELVLATAINDEWPNPEWSTLLLRKLLENGDFRARFISRMALRLHTNFNTERVVGRIDLMSSTIAPEIPRFFERWGRDAAGWSEEVEWLRIIARQRPDFMFTSFASYFGLKGTVTLTIAPGKGTLVIDGVPFTGQPQSIRVFAESPMQLEALPPTGQRFIGYSDGVTTLKRQLTMNGNLDLSLSFE